MDIFRAFIVLSLTLFSGWADSRGFLHASYVWENDRIVWAELAKSALGFTTGLSAYWIVLKFAKQMGIMSPELQTLGWFTVTIIGVALASGKFLEWSVLDKGVAVLVLLGIARLLLTSGG